MRRISFIHPFVFTLVTLLFLYLRAEISVPPTQVLRPLLLMWAGLLLLTWPLYWLTRDWEWTAILLTVFAIGFYAIPRVALGLGAFALFVSVAFWVAVTWLRRRPASTHNLNFALNVASLASLVLAVSILFVQFSGTPGADFRAAVLGRAKPPIAVPQARAGRPDVYYFLIDGYGRSDILRELYGHDNSSFVDHLESMGFTVPAEIHSNYPRTVLSLASTLNMDYTSQFAPGLEASPFWWLLEPYIQHSQVRTMLESMGYRTVAIYNDWDLTNVRSADTFLQPRQGAESDFEFLLLNKTPLGILRPLVRTFAFDRSFGAHRDLVNYQFETVSQAPKLPGPKFVFVHIISPHPPFVFDAQGDPLTPPGAFQSLDSSDFRGTSVEYRQGYVGQVTYLNSQLEKTVESILANSAVPPIIILQADHGPGMLTDWTSAAHTCMQERFSPFAAYYLPGLPAGDIPQDITPVNLFRIIFNGYFSTDLPILQDHSYFPNDPIHIFDQGEVTDRVGLACANGTDLSQP